MTLFSDISTYNNLTGKNICSNESFLVMGNEDSNDEIKIIYQSGDGSKNKDKIEDKIGDRIEDKIENTQICKENDNDINIIDNEISKKKYSTNINDSFTNEEKKQRNKKFIDEIFAKSLASLTRSYNEQKSCLTNMSFDNTIVPTKTIKKCSEITDNKACSSRNQNKNKLGQSLEIKKPKFLKRKYYLTKKELDKMDRFNSLIGKKEFRDFEQSPENSIQNNNESQNESQIELINTNKIIHEEKSEVMQEENSQEPIEILSDEKISNENCQKTDSNEINSQKSNSNSLNVGKDGLNNSSMKDELIDTNEIILDDEDDDDDEIIICHPLPLPSISKNKNNIIPIQAVLTLETSIQDLKPSVTLKWNVKKTKNFCDIHIKYNSIEEKDVHTLIKEFEIYGYRESPHIEIKSLWSMIGTVPCFVPPVQCTLTDFQKDSNYHFAIRIKDNDGYISDFSEPSTAQL